MKTTKFFVGSLLGLVFGICGCYGGTKEWIQDVSYNNPANWDIGRVPCSQDRVVFKEKTSIVFLQVNGTLREVVLPNNGQVVLDNNMEIAFSDDNNVDPQCNGQDITFTADTPKQWFDPDNWQNVESPVTVETEMVPCKFDKVTFPQNNLYSVVLNQSVSVGNINVQGKDYTGSQLTNYLQTSSGKLQFSVENGATIGVMGYQCPDSTGCTCGNDEKPEIRDMICRMSTCSSLACRNAITPEGACCSKCGAFLTMGFEHSSFNMNRFKQMIQTTYGGSVNLNKRSVKRQANSVSDNDIIFYISKTKSQKIQIVITDRQTGSSSGQAAVEMARRIQRDLQRNLVTYGLTSVSLQASSKGTGGRAGGSSGSLSGGAVTGIILVLLIVLGLAGTAIFIYWRRGSFFKDEPLHAEIEMTSPKRLAMEYVQEIPLDKGFDNPIYASTPSPSKGETKLYSDPTKSASPQASNGQQVNGHQPQGSAEKNAYDHEAAANGLEQMEQRDSTIIGLGFTNPMQGANGST